MATPKKKKRYYTLRQEYFNDIFFASKSLRGFSNEIGISENIILNWLDEPVDFTITEEYAKRVMAYRNDPIDMIFSNTDAQVEDVVRDKTYIEVSEELMVGLKENIRTRLSNCHTKPYIEEILNIVDNIIIESAYMGVQLERDKQAQFIVLAAQRRRKG